MQTQPGKVSRMKTPGVCLNTAGCALARRGRRVMVELKQPFVCPGCGAPLSPPVVKEGPPIAVLAGSGAAAVLVIAVLAFLLLSGKSPPPAPKPPAPAQLAAKPAPAPPPPAALAPSIVGSSSPAGPTTAGIIMPPAEPQPPGSPAPGGNPPAGASSAAAASASTPGPGASTKSTTQASPPAIASESAASDVPALPPRHQHRIVSTPHLASRTGKQAQPDMQALDGSRPEYPELYEETGEKGEVTVTCMVQIDGHADDCQVTKQSGGGAFARAVLHWLDRDTTRFPPLLKRGRPAVMPFTWTIEFFP